jgi:hypothetical protein
VGWRNRYPDDMIRRHLEQDGATVTDYFTDGSMYYRMIGDQAFIAMDDDDLRASVIIHYLKRLGQVRGCPIP